MKPRAPRAKVRLCDVDPVSAATVVRRLVVDHWQSVGRVLGAERLPPEADGNALYFLTEALVAFAVTGETEQIREATPEGAFNAVVRALFNHPYTEIQELHLRLPRDHTSEIGVALLAALGRLLLAQGKPLDRHVLEALAGEPPPSFAPAYFPDEDISATDALAWLRRVGVRGLPEEVPCAPPR